jgi:penicillin-binding protein 2
MAENYPGSGERVIPIATENWETISDAMAQTMLTGTAAGHGLTGIDFAGKTGTAQVVSHNFGEKAMGKGNERANSWFVGMVPRRNPDLVVAVLVEHGGFGADAAAPAATQVVNAFVTQQRRREGNLRPQDMQQPAQLFATAPAPAAQPAPVKTAPAVNPKPAANQTPTANRAPRPDGVPTASAIPAAKPGAAANTAVNQP